MVPRHRQTVHIPSLARIGWEVVDSYDRGQGGSGYRRQPLFLPTDNFLRANGIPVKKVVNPPFLTTVDEINFIKLAIKFSEDLTKDQVFCGLRDIVQRLGRVVASGARVELNMSVGKYVAKERKQSFLFDKSVHDAVQRRVPLDEAIITQFEEARVGKFGEGGHNRRGAGTVITRKTVAPDAGDEPLGFDGDAYYGDEYQVTERDGDGGGADDSFVSADSAGGIASPERPAANGRTGSRPASVPSLDLTGSGGGRGGRGGRGERGGGSGAGGSYSAAHGAQQNQTGESSGAFMADLREIDSMPAPSKPTSPSDEGSTLDGRKVRPPNVPGISDKQWSYLAAHHAKNPVMEAAFARFADTTIQDAEDRARETVEIEEAMWNQELEARALKRAKEAERAELAREIRSQIDFERTRKAQEKEQWRSLRPPDKQARAASEHGGDEEDEEYHNGSLIAGPTMYDLKRARSASYYKQRRELNQALAEQVKHREEEDERIRQAERHAEQRYVKHVEQELAEEAEFRRMQDRIVKHDLAKNWGRDIQLKKVLKTKEVAGKKSALATAKAHADPPPPRYRHKEGVGAAVVLGVINSVPHSRHTGRGGATGRSGFRGSSRGSMPRGGGFSRPESRGSRLSTSRPASRGMEGGLLASVRSDARLSVADLGARLDG